jgi:hypothetical protein
MRLWLTWPADVRGTLRDVISMTSCIWNDQIPYCCCEEIRGSLGYVQAEGLCVKGWGRRGGQAWMGRLGCGRMTLIRDANCLPHVNYWEENCARSLQTLPLSLCFVTSLEGVQALGQATASFCVYRCVNPLQTARTAPLNQKNLQELHSTPETQTSGGIQSEISNCFTCRCADVTSV